MAWRLPQVRWCHSNARLPLPALGFAGASPDLSTIVATFNGATLFPQEQALSGSSNLYEITDAGSASPGLRLVNRDSGGNLLGGACGAELGGSRDPGDAAGIGAQRTRAVSKDGSAIYFSARPAAPASGICLSSAKIRIFKRVNGSTTTAVSTSQCTRTVPTPCKTEAELNGNDYYWGASADGSKVFFTSNRQLTDSDLDSTNGFGFTGCAGGEIEQGGCDLYMYDSSPPAGKPNLVQVSAGEAVAGDHPTIGSGADVRGVAGISMDGSRVYFVAKGRLTSGGTKGANNLYVYQRDAAHPDGRIGFVAALFWPVAWMALAQKVMLTSGVKGTAGMAANRPTRCPSTVVSAREWRPATGTCWSSLPKRPCSPRKTRTRSTTSTATTTGLANCSASPASRTVRCRLNLGGKT